MSGNENIVSGDESAMSGNENVVSANEKVMSGNEKVVSGNEKVVSPNEKVMSQDEKVRSRDENVVFVDGGRNGAGFVEVEAGPCQRSSRLSQTGKRSIELSFRSTGGMNSAAMHPNAMVIKTG